MDRGWYRIGVGAPRGAFVPSLVFLGTLAVCVLGGYLAWTEAGNPQFDVFLFVLAGWIVSLSLHEYAHAIFAYHGGDRTVASRGYLKLNPLKYAHPVLSVVLPVAFLLLGGIGLPGGAVWVDHNALRSKNAQSLVSLVGPGMNFALAIVLSIPFIAGVANYNIFFPQGHPYFWAALGFLAYLQLTAAILNLLPLPGLDGGNAVRPWLTAPYDRYYDQFAGVGMLLLFALLFIPSIGAAFIGGVRTVGSLIGVPLDQASLGYQFFKFWQVG
jgi:Zn-dependent protease